MIKKCRFLLTHAHDHATEMEKLYGVKAAQFGIVPHGITLPELLPTFINNTQTCKILYVGRFEYRKGIDVLLDAIPLVLESFPDTVFELIGSDTDNVYTNTFKQKHSPRINSKVLFRGTMNTAATEAAYAGCDIFAAPSRYESFGLIYIEAMSYSKPVIGCKTGGVTEIIQHEINGLFALLDNPQDLAKQIIRLIQEPDLRCQLGIQARKTVEERFSKEKLAENSVNYYRQAVAKFKGH